MKCLQFVIVLPVLWALLCATTTKPFNHNFLLYGDLDEGAGNTPSHSGTETSRPSDSSTSFSWIRQSGAAGELRIANIERDTARWTQTVVPEPSWYRLSVETRTEGFDPCAGTTARGISAPWQVCRRSSGRPGMSEWGTDSLSFQLVSTRVPEVVCPLSGASESWRHIGLTRVAGEPSADAQKVELGNLSAMSPSNRKELFLKNYLLGMERAKQLSELRRVHNQIDQMCRNNWHSVHFVPATGSYWSIVVTMLLLVAIPIFGWRLLGETKPR
jgi:hypothetical protein